MNSLKDQLIGSYLSWLKQKITLKDLDNGVIEITSPFMDRNNDHLQIYVVVDDQKLKLTDDSYIISELEMSGCDIKLSKRRKEIFTSILNGYGVKHSPRDELFIETSMKDFPQKKHMLLQAMLAVNDMFMTTRENVYSLFIEDVENFLLDSDIRYTENAKFTGKTGYTHKFDFVIPRSKKSPERMINTLNNPTKDKTESLIFTWTDTKETRKEGSRLYTFLNDMDKNVSTDITNAFLQYDITPILWSDRKKYIDELAS